MLEIPISKFDVWRSWLADLGGTFEPYRDFEERKKHTDGRRNRDTKPGEHPLDNEKYGQDPKTGTIWRRQRDYPEGD